MVSRRAVFDSMDVIGTREGVTPCSRVEVPFFRSPHLIKMRVRVEVSVRAWAWVWVWEQVWAWMRVQV